MRATDSSEATPSNPYKPSAASLQESSNGQPGGRRPAKIWMSIVGLAALAVVSLPQQCSLSSTNDEGVVVERFVEWRIPMAEPLALFFAAGAVVLWWRSEPSRTRRRALDRAARARRRLSEIVATEPSTGASAAEETPYGASSDEQLVDVYEHINRDIEPERFAALIEEIRRRTEQGS